jgi:hypothetical protein
MHTFAKAAACAAALALVASPVLAAQFLTEAPPAVDGSLAWDFGDDGGIAAGLFTEDFILNFPVDGFADGSVSTTFTSKATDLTFASITLGTHTFTLFDFSGFHGAHLDPTLFTGGPVTLEIKGTSPGPSGSYDGHIAFAPVPEPLGWALMIFGFGGVGAALRSRRRETLATA